MSTFGNTTGLPLEEYEFEVLTVNSRGQIIKGVWQQARYYREPLGNGIDLEMVYIPGGLFPWVHRKLRKIVMTVKDPNIK